MLNDPNKDLKLSAQFVPQDREAADPTGQGKEKKNHGTLCLKHSGQHRP